jgi:hypothetical protein
MGGSRDPVLLLHTFLRLSLHVLHLQVLQIYKHLWEDDLEHLLGAGDLENR